MKKQKLGSGKRFSDLTKKLSSESISNPSALAAYIGRKKYGPEKMASLASKGKKSSGSRRGC